MSFVAAVVTAGVLGTGELGLGIADKIGAGKKRKNAQSFFAKNQYQIPDSAKAALDNAQKNASSINLPGEDLTRAKLGETTARGVGVAKTAGTSSADILTHLSSLFGNEQRQDTGLGIAGTNRWDSNQRYLGSALDKMAGYEIEKWKNNVLYPYQQMVGQAGQQDSNANQEISGGVGQVASAASAGMTAKTAQTNLDTRKLKMFGGGATAEVPGGNYNEDTRW